MTDVTKSLFSDVPMIARSPFPPETIADDVLYAFAHGWLDLPTTVVGDEASERLTRLYLARKFAENDRG